MTNFEKWMEYTSGLSSPESFCKWGWLYLIGACLQRRVWLSATHKKCFANTYTILVGPPGTGKGLVINEVSSFLKHWKLGDVKFDERKDMSKEQKEIAQMTVETDCIEAAKRELQGTNAKADIVKPSLYVVGANATTYEALIQATAASYRRINYMEFNDQLQKSVPRIYGHSSVCFSLPELSSLLRKRTNDTVNFLLELYDCPDDYEYDTKTQGKDRLRRGCINLLAGTTPAFMQSTFDDRLVDEGLSSRTFYVYARKGRKRQFFVPDLVLQQTEYKKELLEHIKGLSCLYGQCNISKETWDRLQNWWEERPKHYPNKSVKLMPFYERENIHVMKLAMAKHFGETHEMTIPWETFEWAIDFINTEEKSMHLALCMEGNTPMGRAIRRVLDGLVVGEKCAEDLTIELMPSILSSMKEVEECLSFLRDTSQIMCLTKHSEEYDRNLVYYSLK